MKGRKVHLTDVTPYEFWARPTDAPQFQWFCDCGAVASGYPTEQSALVAGVAHETEMGTVRTSDGTASVYDASTGRWEAASGILAVSAGGWVAFGAVILVVAAVVLVFWWAHKAPTIEEINAAPPWVRSDPAVLWGLLSTDQVPPAKGDTIKIPGHEWVFDGDDWQPL